VGDGYVPKPGSDSAYHDPLSDLTVRGRQADGRSALIADELAKLVDVRDRSILTGEEFERQKQLLLSPTAGDVRR